MKILIENILISRQIYSQRISLIIIINLKKLWTFIKENNKMKKTFKLQIWEKIINRITIFRI